jgi:hypothetical protein
MGEEGSIRANVSLPRELKRQMDAVTEPVNWSAVAAGAFRAKLLELESRKEGKTMDDVVARLRAADEMDRSEDYQEGRQAGEEWARDYARPRHLRRLRELADEPEFGLRNLDVFANGGNNGIAWDLYRYLHPRQDVDRVAVKVFWEEVLGDDGADRMEDVTFARGFCEGALDVWGKVEKKL